VLLLQIPLIGLSNLLTIKISFFKGKKEFSELNQLTKKYINLYLLEAIFIVAALYLFYPNIIKIFTVDNATIQNMLQIKPYIILFFIMNLMLSFNMSALRGLSDNFIPQVIILTLLTLGIIPWITLPLNIDLTQLITLFVISGLCASIILIFRFKRRFNIIQMD